MRTLADRKLNTIASIAQLEDETLLALIEQILANSDSEDWAGSLSQEDRTDIEEGLKDIDSGRFQDYEAFMEHMKQKFP